MSQLQEKQLFADRYRLVKKLGSGAFSEVWKAEDTKAGNLVVAIKIYAPDKGMDEEGIAVFSHEFSLVYNVNHQNLLKPTSFDECNGSPFLVLPFCSKGSAMKLIGGITNERDIIHFIHDVAAGLEYLHKQDPPIIHQDIKPDNILISEDGEYKLTDFGISTRIRSTLRRSFNSVKSAGTMAYMAPERFDRNPEPIKASDIWSLGATVFEMMEGDAPFGNLGGVLLKNGAEIPEIGENYSNELKQLIERCLSKETWDRPTAKDLRKATELFLEEGELNFYISGKKINDSNVVIHSNSNKKEKSKTNKKPTLIVSIVSLCLLIVGSILLFKWINNSDQIKEAMSQLETYNQMIQKTDKMVQTINIYASGTLEKLIEAKNAFTQVYQFEEKYKSILPDDYNKSNILQTKLDAKIDSACVIWKKTADEDKKIGLDESAEETYYLLNQLKKNL